MTHTQNLLIETDSTNPGDPSALVEEVSGRRQCGMFTSGAMPMCHLTGNMAETPTERVLFVPRPDTVDVIPSEVYSILGHHFKSDANGTIIESRLETLSGAVKSAGELASRFQRLGSATNGSEKAIQGQTLAGGRDGTCPVYPLAHADFRSVDFVVSQSKGEKLCTPQGRRRSSIWSSKKALLRRPAWTLRLDELDLTGTASQNVDAVTAAQNTASDLQLCADFVKAASSAGAEHVVIFAPHMTLPSSMSQSIMDKPLDGSALARLAILEQLRLTGGSDKTIDSEGLPSLTVAWTGKLKECKAKFDSGEISDAASFVQGVRKA